MIIGIDLGSRNVKICLKKDSGIENKIFDTISFYRNYFYRTEEGLKLDLNKLGINPNKVKQIISTGYGRNNVEIHGSKKIPELKAHYLAVNEKIKISNYTLLDIGGQDTKVIRVEQGKMIDFHTNDKCAAGTGRYLENMASLLGIKIEELADYYENPVTINNTCAIFGESEIIGKVAMGEEIENIYSGVNYSVYKRTENLLSRYNKDILVFSGGVSRNRAINKYIENFSGYDKVIRLENSIYNGAIGCCLYGEMEKRVF